MVDDFCIHCYQHVHRAPWIHNCWQHHDRRFQRLSLWSIAWLLHFARRLLTVEQSQRRKAPKSIRHVWPRMDWRLQ